MSAGTRTRSAICAAGDEELVARQAPAVAVGWPRRGRAGLVFEQRGSQRSAIRPRRFGSSACFWASLPNSAIGQGAEDRGLEQRDGRGAAADLFDHERRARGSRGRRRRGPRGSRGRAGRPPPARSRARGRSAGRRCVSSGLQALCELAAVAREIWRASSRESSPAGLLGSAKSMGAASVSWRLAVRSAVRAAARDRTCRSGRAGSRWCRRRR